MFWDLSMKKFLLKGNCSRNGYNWESSRLSRNADGIQLCLAKAKGSFVPPERSLALKFEDIASLPQSLRISGQKIKRGLWKYNNASKVLTVRTNDTTSEKTMQVRF